ncbi:MAG: methyltransferase, partial [Pseudomonadota bacterium]
MISSAPASPEGPDGEDLTSDAFLGGRIEILQLKTGHRGGSDAVFLAAATHAQKGDRVLDAGCGAGTAGLCLLARVPETDVTGVEISETQCALAKRNAARNDFQDRFRCITADVTSPAKQLAEAGLIRESFDHVIANPPFFRSGAVRAAPDASRAAAHVMAAGGLEHWVRFLTTMA